MLDEGDLVITLGSQFRGFKGLNHIEDPKEVDIVGMIPSQFLFQFTKPMDEYPGIGLYAQGERHVIIAYGKPVLLISQNQLALFQGLTVRPPQKGGQHPPFDAFIGMIPVDVKETKIPGPSPVLQHVHEDLVFRNEGHVIRHDVLEPKHGIIS